MIDYRVDGWLRPKVAVFRGNGGVPVIHQTKRLRHLLLNQSHPHVMQTTFIRVLHKLNDALDFAVDAYNSGSYASSLNHGQSWSANPKI
jgi:hypothetical protein